MRTIKTVEELIQFVDLKGITPYQLVATRKDAPSYEEVDESFDTKDAAGKLKMSVLAKPSPSQIELVFVTRIETDEAGCSLELGRRDEHTEELEVSELAIQGLINRVAGMTVWPFIRQSAFSLATQIEVPVPLLGMIRQGDFDAMQDAE